MKNTFALLSVLFMSAGFLSSCTNDHNRQDDSKSLVGSGYGIDKATIVVDNLDSATRYYRDVLGFNMPPPEDFENGIYGGTLSASADFSDGSAIELMDVRDTSLISWSVSAASSYRLNKTAQLFSLSTSSADTTRSWLISREFMLDSLRSGRTSRDTAKGWDWDDGGPEWRMVRFDDRTSSGYFPAFVELVGFPYREIDEEWTTFLTGYRPYFEHPNGVIGIAAVLIAVDDIKKASKDFRQMGFIELKSGNPKTLARFQIAHRQELQLVAPESPQDSLSDFLKTGGPRLLAYRFEVKNLKATQEYFKNKLPAESMRIDSMPAMLTISKEHAYGIALEFVEEPKEQSAMARRYNFKKGSKLDTASLQYAAGLYSKYCALCHGNNREGYAADFAPSLRSHSLMSTTQSSNYLKHAINYGRQGTPMAAYAIGQGGPLHDVDVDLLLQWMYELSGVEKSIDLSTEPVNGNITAGKVLYSKHCASCHGEKGEGVKAPALGNAMLLATASDAFIRYAIAEGRDGTIMPSFKDSLSNTEMDALTAYIRSRASGWAAPEAITVTEPLPENYILNGNKRSPEFTLREGQYVSAEQLLQALNDSTRLIILDARSKAAWHQSHIPGAVSVPYYEEPDAFMKHIPKDSTMIAVYCACPHAASERVVNTLNRFGYRHTAILDEGVLVWAQRGYPLEYGQEAKAKK